DGERYFDVFVEYAKGGPDDLLIRVTAVNRGPEAAPLHLLPTFWFRNTWSWGTNREGHWPKPTIRQAVSGAIELEQATLGEFVVRASPGPDGQPPRWLFTDNETNHERLDRSPNGGPFVKDAFHEFVVHGKNEAVNAEGVG